MKAIPTEFEVYDDISGEYLAKIKTFDEVCVTVDIKNVQTVESWDTMAPEIGKCIKLMLPEDDKR